MAPFSQKIKRYRRKVRYALIYWLVRSMIFISNQLPRVFWVKFCGRLGSLSYYFLRDTRRLVKKHLTMVYQTEKSEAEINAITKDVFRKLGCNAGDVIRSFKIKVVDELNAIRVIHGSEHLENAFRAGNGVIMLSGHLGAFELLALEMAFRGYRPLIIGSKMKDQRLNDLLNRQRSRLGALAIERGKDSIKLLKNLKSGGSIAMLIDQDTRVKSVFVDFFGIPCATPIGATLLAMRTGAPIVPMFIHLREDYQQEIQCYPPVEFTITGNEEVDIKVNTQKLNNCIENEIRKYPSQWVWMHERWKTKPGEAVE